jgi:hypothetical protein
LRPEAAKKTVWANCGASQFHLPKGETAQVIPGMIGLRYDSLDGLKQRLEKVKEGVVKSSDLGVDAQGRETLKLVESHGNVFLCRSGGNPVSDVSLNQPIIKPTESVTWGWIAEKYGRDMTECQGVDFVEFLCPLGTAHTIASFYENVLDATTSVLEKSDGRIAIIGVGNIYASGKADQSLLFRETSQEIPQYDGHHVALYVGESQADFEQAFKNCVLANVVWVNPRFEDEANDLRGARKWKQFRFKNIVDMETGETIFELEHEMRSIEHEAWPRKSNF